jgi:hypothetical protein
MCLYWKKMHTCNHLSDRPYIEMCREGFLSNTVCPDISEDSQPRPSHFPCYPCIKTEARAEMEDHARMEQVAMAKAREAHERAVKEKQAAELRAKEERVRREARDKAAREREAEHRIKREKEDQERQARKEGGAWIETAGAKKPRGRKSGSGAAVLTPITPINASPSTMRTVAVPRNTKENGPAGGGGDKMSPKKGRGGDPGGRAGTWGPKKILSRLENGVGGNGAVTK